MNDSSTTAAYYAGIDWAKHEHVVHLADADGAPVARTTVPHTGEGMAALDAWLRAHTAGGPLLVAIEMSNGPVVESMQHYGHAVLSVNPRQLAAFRTQRSMSGAKDDARDARLLAELAGAERRERRSLAPEADATLTGRATVQHRLQLVEQRTAMIQQLLQWLWQYFPALAALGRGRAAEEWFLTLCEAVPTPADAARVTVEEIAARLPRRRGPQPNVARWLEQLRVPPLPVAAGTVRGASRAVLGLIPLIRATNQAIAAAEAERDAIIPATAAATGLGAEGLEIIRSMPGIGPEIAATLLTYDRENLATGNAAGVDALWGLAPITVQSGARRGVRMRRSVSQPLRRAAHLMAQAMVRHDPAAKNYYETLRGRRPHPDPAVRQRGAQRHTHGQALRCVARRQFSILRAMLRDGTRYDPNRTSMWSDPETEETEAAAAAHAV